MRNMRERQRFSKESLYSESTIDKVLSNYFIQKNDNKTYGKVQKISESYEQESSANKFLNKYPKAKLLGKTSKGNLVFEMYDEKFYISPNGKIA
jgi:cyclophilin family peptidyl-prolyl cis-trans isomerase